MIETATLMTLLVSCLGLSAFAMLRRARVSRPATVRVVVPRYGRR